MPKKLVKKKLGFKPNLKNYEQAKKNFSWFEAAKEIDYFSNNTMNAAYVAIDINAQNFRKNKIALYWEGENGEEFKYTYLEMSQLSNLAGSA
jgi:acetyl-CoA synthetase